MRRLATLLAVAAAGSLTAAPGAAAAPLGPLRVAIVRDGFDRPLNGVAADGSGGAWTVVYATDRFAFARTDGRRLTHLDPVRDVGYVDVFSLPGGRVLQLGVSQAAIVAGDVRTVVAEKLPQPIGSIGAGPLGVWFWTYDDTGSGLTLIRPDAAVVHFPRTFTFQISAGIVASDATGVWIETRRIDEGTELSRIDAEGVHDIARFATGELGPASLDAQGRLLLATLTGGRPYLRRLEADGTLRTVVRLPKSVQPARMETDAHGAVWIADFAVPRLLRVSRAGRMRSVDLGLPSTDHIRAMDVSGGDVWFTTDRVIGRLVTTPGRCVVPDVRGLAVREAQRAVRRADCAPRGATRGAHVVRQSPPPGTVLRTRGHVELTNGPRRQLRTPAACSLDRTASVLARGTSAFVALESKIGGKDHELHSTWTVCHPATGRATAILHAAADSLGGFKGPSHFAFSGRRVAYVITYANHYSDANLVLHLLDARSGRTRIDVSIGGLAGYLSRQTEVQRLLLSGERVVYLVRDPVERTNPDGTLAPSFDRLAVLSPTGQRILEEAPAGAISNVRIDGDVVTWVSGGEARDAPLG